MKLLLPSLLLFIFSFFSSRTQAQVVAYAGPDNVVCANDTAYYLKGSAWGGTAPYTYKWWVAEAVDGYVASDMLVDTTKPDTKFRSRPVKNIRLYVEATDQLGLTGIDSVDLYFSLYTYLTVTPTVVINKGDSVKLYSTASGGVGTIRYFWFPGGSVSDSSIAEPWAKPDTTTNYNVFLMDSGGCTALTTFKVIVWPLGISESQVATSVTVHPNPAQDRVLFRVSGNVSAAQQLLVLDSFGKQVREITITGKETVMERGDLASGIYFYQLINSSGELLQGKLLFE